MSWIFERLLELNRLKYPTTPVISFFFLFWDWHREKDRMGLFMDSLERISSHSFNSVHLLHTKGPINHGALSLYIFGIGKQISHDLSNGLFSYSKHLSFFFPSPFLSIFQLRSRMVSIGNIVLVFSPSSLPPIPIFVARAETSCGNQSASDTSCFECSNRSSVAHLQQVFVSFCFIYDGSSISSLNHLNFVLALVNYINPTVSRFRVWILGCCWLLETPPGKCQWKMSDSRGILQSISFEAGVISSWFWGSEIFIDSGGLW